MNLLDLLFGPPVPAIAPTDLHAQLKSQPAPLLMDIRQPDEFAQGHIAQARLIPLADLGRRLTELPKDRQIVCVCESGNRSGAAARQLLPPVSGPST